MILLHFSWKDIWEKRRSQSLLDSTNAEITSCGKRPNLNLPRRCKYSFIIVADFHVNCVLLHWSVLAHSKVCLLNCHVSAITQMPIENKHKKCAGSGECRTEETFVRVSTSTYLSLNDAK